MSAPSDPSARGTPRDPVALALLLAGVSLALAVAFTMPTLHFRGADKSLLGLAPWDAVPWLTKLKLGFLAAAVAAAFLPRLAALRVPLTAAAVVMMFLPAIGALVAAVYQWSDVRAGIVQMAGVRTPWIDPGWGIVALLVAALMVTGSLWRAHRAAAAAAIAAR